MSLRFKLLIPSLAAALLLPAAAAQAKTVSGTVLQTDRSHHVLRVVEAAGRVESFRFSGALDRNVRPGSVVRLSSKGHRAGKIHAQHRARKLRVLGRVVRSSGAGLVVSLADGRLFQVQAGRQGHARSAHAATNVSVNVLGLEPGQLVMITIEYLPGGDVNITIELQKSDSSTPPADGSGGGDNGGQPQCAGPDAADGKVLGIDRTNGTFTIGQRWSDEAVYHASAELLAHIHEGDQVLVRFDPADSSTATDARIISSAVAARDPEVQVADGTVNRINGDAAQFTVIQSNHSGALTLNAPCWVLNQVWVSEDVHVIYHRAANGDLVTDAVDANDGSEF